MYINQAALCCEILCYKMDTFAVWLLKRTKWQANFNSITILYMYVMLICLNSFGWTVLWHVHFHTLGTSAILKLVHPYVRTKLQHSLIKKSNNMHVARSWLTRWQRRKMHCSHYLAIAAVVGAIPLPFHGNNGSKNLVTSQTFAHYFA